MWSGVVEVMSTAPPAEDDSALAVLSGAMRRAKASAVAMSHWSARALTGSPRSRSALTGRLPSSSGASANSRRSRVESSSSSHRLGRSSSVTPCRPSGGTMWLPGGRWPPSMTSRMCGVAARSSAPKRGRSLRSGGSRLPRSSREVETRRIGPTASASRVLCACGSHFTQSQWVRFCSELRTATTSWSGFWNAVAEQIIARAVERHLLGVAAELDAVEGAQVDRRRQVGLEAVHDEEPVQGGRGGRVDLVHRRALRRHQLQRQRLRAQAVAHVQEVVVGRGVLPQPGAVLGQRGQRGGLGVVPVERPPLLVGGVARDLADVAEVAQVLGARAGDLLRTLLTLPVDLDDDEAERGEQEHAGREEAAALVGAAHRRDEHDGAEAAEHRDGVHQHAAGALALLQLGRRLQHDLATRHLRLVEPLTAPQCRAQRVPQCRAR